jgi:hypothetical protein
LKDNMTFTPKQGHTTGSPKRPSDHSWIHYSVPLDLREICEQIAKDIRSRQLEQMENAGATEEKEHAPPPDCSRIFTDGSARCPPISGDEREIDNLRSRLQSELQAVNRERQRIVLEGLALKREGQRLFYEKQALQEERARFTMERKTAEESDAKARLPKTALPTGSFAETAGAGFSRAGVGSGGDDRGTVVGVVAPISGAAWSSREQPGRSENRFPRASPCTVLLPQGFDRLARDTLAIKCVYPGGVSDTPDRVVYCLKHPIHGDVIYECLDDGRWTRFIVETENWSFVE